MIALQKLVSTSHLKGVVIAATCKWCIQIINSCICTGSGSTVFPTGLDDYYWAAAWLLGTPWVSYLNDGCGHLNAVTSAPGWGPVGATLFYKGVTLDSVRDTSAWPASSIQRNGYVNIESSLLPFSSISWWISNPARRLHHLRYFLPSVAMTGWKSLYLMNSLLAFRFTTLSWPRPLSPQPPTPLSWPTPYVWLPLSSGPSGSCQHPLPPPRCPHHFMRVRRTTMMHCWCRGACCLLVIDSGDYKTSVSRWQFEGVLVARGLERRVSVMRLTFSHESLVTS